KYHLTEALPYVGTTARNFRGRCTIGHSVFLSSPRSRHRIHLWSAEDGVVSFYLNCPGNAVPLLEASRNQDVARVADKAMRFHLSEHPRTRNPGMHRRWDSDALLHCDRCRSEI